MQDCVILVRYRTGFGIISFFQSGTGQTGCRTVRHSGISIYMSIDIDIDMNMQHGHGHAVWTWTHSTDLVMQLGPGQCTYMEARMPECR